MAVLVIEACYNASLSRGCSGFRLNHYLQGFKDTSPISVTKLVTEVYNAYS
jgi:hypothetical protein